MTIKDITLEEFESWKTNCRNEFKDDPESMNLINICLNALDKNSSQDSNDKFNERLLEFYHNELAHSNKLECEHCGNKMTVYYTVQCFKCQKPEDDNYFKMIYWLENHEEDFDKDEFWSELCDREILFGNDTYIRLHDSNKDDEYGRNLKLIKKHFDITKPLFVSW